MIEVRSVVSQDWGGQWWPGRGTTEPLQMWGISYILPVVIFTRVFTFVEAYHTARFKWVHFPVCNLYLKQVDFYKLRKRNYNMMK